MVEVCLVMGLERNRAGQTMEATVPRGWEEGIVAERKTGEKGMRRD